MQNGIYSLPICTCRRATASHSFPRQDICTFCSGYVQFFPLYLHFVCSCWALALEKREVSQGEASVGQISGWKVYKEQTSRPKSRNSIEDSKRYKTSQDGSDKKQRCILFLLKICIWKQRGASSHTTDSCALCSVFPSKWPETEQRYTAYVIALNITYGVILVFGDFGVLLTVLPQLYVHMPWCGAWLHRHCNNHTAITVQKICRHNW